MTVIPITREMAMASATLQADFHSDSADRLIVATARVHTLTLITADKQIQNYAHVRTSRG